MVSVMPLADVSMNLRGDVEFIVEGSEFDHRCPTTDDRRKRSSVNGHRSLCLLLGDSHPFDLFLQF